MANDTASEDPHDLSPSRVVCAANRCVRTGLILAGPRHFGPIMHSVMIALDAKGGGPTWQDSEQGFIDQHGVFLTREQAWVVAERNGQILRRFDCGREGVLYSEHLY
jgi:hypothetical protein